MGNKVLTTEFVAMLRNEFPLDWRGIHGAPHWARVRYNGMQLAARNGANATLVELFAFLHDARREHDGGDRDHGERAAALVRELNGRFYSLARQELRLLELACRDHSLGLIDHPSITVQTCWDADRLDLGRVGIRPVADRLCTDEARGAGVIEAAYARSIGW